MTLGDGRRLGHPPGGQGHGGRHQQDDDPAHEPRRLQAGFAKLRQEDGKAHDRQDAQQRSKLQPSVDSRPLIIARRKAGGQSQLGQRQDRPAEEGGRQGREQIQRPHPRLGHEEQIDRQHQRRRAKDEPGPVAAPAASGTVHRRPQQGIDHDVEDAHAGENDADDGQGQPQNRGVMLRDHHHQRQGQGAQRNAHQRQRQQAWRPAITAGARRRARRD
ncbi:hypothetical protein D3C80_922620 [compost metagenome]